MPTALAAERSFCDVERSAIESALPISFVALAALGDGFRVLSAILGQRSADIIAFVKLALVIASDVAFVARMRFDEFSVVSGGFFLSRLIHAHRFSGRGLFRGRLLLGHFSSHE
jgi:hypothetical protein